MVKATRDLKVNLALSESEANDLYIHIRPKYSPNKTAEIKEAIRDALGYTPKEPPQQ